MYGPILAIHCYTFIVIIIIIIIIIIITIKKQSYLSLN